MLFKVEARLAEKLAHFGQPLQDVLADLE